MNINNDYKISLSLIDNDSFDDENIKILAIIKDELFLHNKSYEHLTEVSEIEKLDVIASEYIRLKAIEQAAKDLTKEIDNVLDSPKGIAYYFCNQLTCEHCKKAQSDYRQLKELLQID